MNKQQLGANLLFGCEYFPLFRLFLGASLVKENLNMAIYSHPRATFAPKRCAEAYAVECHWYWQFMSQCLSSYIRIYTKSNKGEIRHWKSLKK